MIAIMAGAYYVQNFRDMGITGYNSVGTQTPTEERSFEFPESASPGSSPSSNSIVGVRTGNSTRMPSLDEPSPGKKSQAVPKLFRRHSTGSDVYNFGNTSSPTLLAAHGGTPTENRGGFSRRFFPDISITEGQAQESCEDLSTSPESVKDVGQKLREIADNFDCMAHRKRSSSVVRNFGPIGLFCTGFLIGIICYNQA